MEHYHNVLYYPEENKCYNRIINSNKQNVITQTVNKAAVTATIDKRIAQSDKISILSYERVYFSICLNKISVLFVNVSVVVVFHKKTVTNC